MTSNSALAFALGQYNVTPKIRIDGKEYTLKQIEAIVRAYYKLEKIVGKQTYNTKGKDEIQSIERVETIQSKDTSKTTKSRSNKSKAVEKRS